MPDQFGMPLVDHRPSHEVIEELRKQLAAVQAREAELLGAQELNRNAIRLAKHREAELMADNARLRDFLRDLSGNFDCDSDAHKYGTTCRSCAAEALLAATPAQSLARIRNQVREECAVVADAWEHDKRIAAAIRAMKEAE